MAGSGMTGSLLEPADPPAFEWVRKDGQSVFVLAADHAGTVIPRRLGTLGLSSGELGTHIACDLGIGGVARALSDLFDAPLLLQNYSRLVIDCNRSLSAPDSIATTSENIVIPGNRSLSLEEREARRREVFDPYHGALGAHLAERQCLKSPTIFIALHSMTPVYLGVHRPMSAAVLFGNDDRFARSVLNAFRSLEALDVAENEPYALDANSDYTVPHHIEGRFPYVEIEIRQDLIATSQQQNEWAERLYRVIGQAERDFAGDGW
jgi:predicted N-formylglutamate amidohydrolase